MAGTSTGNEYELLRTDTKDSTRSEDNDGIGNGFGGISPARNDNDDGNRSGANKTDRKVDRIYSKDVHLNLNATSVNVPEAEFKRPNLYTQKRIFALGALFACLCLLTIGAAILHFYGIKPCGCKYTVLTSHFQYASIFTHTKGHAQLMYVYIYG